MDPAQGETGGKSITSKLKEKVKGVKGKVHLPGHKKRHGDEGASSDYNSDDSPGKPGPETGYNVGGSTPFTTVKTTPLSPAREKTSHHESHNRDYDSRPSHNTSPRVANYPNDQSYQTGQPHPTSTTEGMPKIGYSENPSSPNKPSEGVLEHVKDTVGGAAAAVGSKMGYYTEVDETAVVPSSRDPNAPSVMDKAKATLGMDKPSDPNAPTLMEKTKASLGLGPSSPNAVTSPSAGAQPGVIDRVSGAMSSLFTSSPKVTGEDVQRTFPAQSDYVPPAATVPHQTYGDRSKEESITPTSTGAYNPTVNRY